ncbi:MAG: type II toxin-antitoxin system Phd/YefM family antitoxin [Candidatus Binataceae bacterium]
MKRKTIDILEAKTQLSRLIEDAAAGTEIVITIDGRPRARLVAYADAVKPRRPGALKGRVRVRADFDALLPPDIGRPFGVR